MLIFFLFFCLAVYPYEWHESKINFIWKNYDRVNIEKVIYLKNLLCSFFYSILEEDRYDVFFDRGKEYQISKLRKTVFIPDLNFEKTFNFLNRAFDTDFDYKAKKDYARTYNFNGEIFVSRWQAGNFFVDKREGKNFFPIIFDSNYVEMLDATRREVLYKIGNLLYILKNGEGQVIFKKNNFFPLEGKILNKGIYFTAIDSKLNAVCFFEAKKGKTKFLFKIKGQPQSVLFSYPYVFFVEKREKFSLFFYNIKTEEIKRVLEDKKIVKPLIFRKDLGIVVYNRGIWVYNLRGKGRIISDLKDRYVFENYDENFVLFSYEKSKKSIFKRVFGKYFYVNKEICFFDENNCFFLDLIRKFRNDRRLYSVFDSKFLYSIERKENGLRSFNIVEIKGNRNIFKMNDKKNRVILFISLSFLFIFLVLYTYVRKRLKDEG